jgi:glycerol uptake facilitator-like aquaporin
LTPDYFTRAIAYFIGFMIAVGVSGAHFNPATTLAVFIINRKYKEHAKYLGLVIFA